MIRGKDAVHRKIAAGLLKLFISKYLQQNLSAIVNIKNNKSNCNR